MNKKVWPSKNDLRKDLIILLRVLTKFDIKVPAHRNWPLRDSYIDEQIARLLRGAV